MKKESYVHDQSTGDHTHPPGTGLYDDGRPSEMCFVGILAFLSVGAGGFMGPLFDMWFTWIWTFLSVGTGDFMELLANLGFVWIFTFLSLGLRDFWVSSSMGAGLLGVVWFDGFCKDSVGDLA